MSIKISSKAIKEILKIKKNKNIKYEYLRFGIRKNNIDGFFTQFYEFVKSPDDADKVFGFENLNVCMDQKSYMFLNGMTVDCKDDSAGSLEFKIPEIAHMCGCNGSFIFEDVSYG